MKAAVIFTLLLLSSGLYLKAQSLPNYTVTAWDPQSTGYYFMAPTKLGAGGHSVTPAHIILDGQGRPVYLKTFAGSTSDFKLQRDGRISYTLGGKFYIMDSTFTVKDSVAAKHGLLFDGHDLQILPNGHFLLLGYENVTMDLSGYPIFNGSNSGSATAAVKCNVIQEQDAAKNVVFEWHCKNHYSFADVDPHWLTNPGNVDWTHANAVEQDADGNFLLSLRHFNEITKIRRSDSSIIWRLGGAANQFSFTNDPGMFKAQHDIRRIANGHITLFDDGAAGPPLHAAAAKEYALDETAHTATLTWSHNNNANTYSGALGSVQRLANGNTLINYGQYFNMNVMFNVVNASGNTLFEIAFADTAVSYRAFNYPSLPWDLKRPVIACYMKNGQSYLDAGSGQGSYLWSNGATTQTIAVSTPGDYQVAVPKGQGGLIYSEPYPVNDLSNVCQATALSNTAADENDYTVFPNPFGDRLTVVLRQPDNAGLFLTDVTGKRLSLSPEHAGNRIILDTHGLSAGLYFLSIQGRTVKLVKE